LTRRHGARRTQKKTGKDEESEEQSFEEDEDHKITKNVIEEKGTDSMQNWVQMTKKRRRIIKIHGKIKGKEKLEEA